eukprot:Hpha_TRINITY_DN15544_c2_g15::TRINITY_DN15544_c2_g15_i1::g.108199::m.108199/K17616/CTDSPL2; CTD small phosphatase-like protein 2
MGNCGSAPRSLQDSTLVQMRRKSTRSDSVTSTITSSTVTAGIRKVSLATPGHDETPGTPLLYRREVKYTLVLDIDECLIRTEMLQRGPPLIHKRPNLAKFISGLLPLKEQGLEVILWTSSNKAQAGRACGFIDELRNVIDSVIWRGPKWVTKDPSGVLVDQATGMNMRCFKDLSLLGRNTDRCILIDNAPQNCFCDQTQSIVVEDFDSPTKQRNDKTLLALGEIVKLMVESDLDVAPFLERSSYQGLFQDVKVNVPGLEEMRLRMMKVDRLLSCAELREKLEKDPTELAPLESSPVDATSCSTSDCENTPGELSFQFDDMGVPVKLGF